MATCVVPFQTQLSSIMEALVKAAVLEISQLVEDKVSLLQRELSRRQSENDALRRRLRPEARGTPPPPPPQRRRGLENYMDRGAAAGGCPHPTGSMKFPEVDEAAVSFAIKEESPDEMLWVSEPGGPMGPAAHYRRPPGAAEGRRAARSEAKGAGAPEFGDPYARHDGDGGPQLTVKTEKEEDRSPGFGQDGCRHGAAAKPAQLAADFSMDERDSQLWSSIIEGNDIDAGFPDFSSVVEEYSNTFPDHSDVHAAAAAAAQPCNGVYAGGDVPLASGGFKPRPPERPKEELHAQRSAAAAAGEHSHAGCFHAHRAAAAGAAAAAAARGFACSHCGKTFGRHHQFKLHQQSHKRKRAFWCTVCGKSFQCSSHLGIHHRTHTGEKPYGCGQCGKRFTQQSSLRVHQRTHSGERPYSCSLCGKTFILMHHLKRHRIIHSYS